MTPTCRILTLRRTLVGFVCVTCGSGLTDPLSFPTQCDQNNTQNTHTHARTHTHTHTHRIQLTKAVKKQVPHPVNQLNSQKEESISIKLAEQDTFWTGKQPLAAGLCEAHHPSPGANPSQTSVPKTNASVKQMRHATYMCIYSIVGPLHGLDGTAVVRAVEINGNGPALLLHPRQIGIIPMGHLAMTSSRAERLL